MEIFPRQPAQLAMFCTQGMGHLIPLVELARKLVQLQPGKFTITFIIPNDGSPMKAQTDILQSLLPSINSILLPQVNFDDLPEDTVLEARVLRSVTRSFPALHQALSQLKETSRLAAYVVDIFGMVTLDVAKDLGIPSYVFFPSPAVALSLSLELPQLDESWNLEYRDLPEPVRLPGCMPIPGSYFPGPCQDRKAEAYKGILEICKKFPLAEGVLVNSFLDLENDTLKALEESKKPPVYPVGPLIRTGSSIDEHLEESECLKWLDKQPAGSVLYVSFGSGGTLSREQLKELALGLEMSGQRFLTVAKNPNDKARNAAYIDVIEQDNMESLFEGISNGFIERTKEKGFIVSQWAPQVEVLGHRAVGGFLTHCGWNSTLEGISHGVPLIAWPLFAEQKLIALMLDEVLQIALRVRENEKGLVDSEQIAILARKLIEGEEGKEIKDKMRDLKDAAAKALGPNGSSTKSLVKVAEKWISMVS